MGIYRSLGSQIVSTDTVRLEEEGGALLLASGDESPSALPSGDIGGVLLQPPEGGSLGSPLGLRQHGWE